jgi:actin, other eukaryote
MSSIEEKLKKMEVRFDQEEYVVIDNGTGFIKAGFSGQDLPRLVIPTVVGEHIEPIDPSMQTNVNDVQVEKKTYAFGNAAYQRKDTHSLYEPIKRGIMSRDGKTDWDNMELIWQHIFNELNLETKNVNLLITDSPFAEKCDRQMMAEILFDRFKVKSLQIMNTAALSMYSTGKVTGLICESGEALTYTVPIFEGYALPHAYQKLEVAGQDVTQRLIDQLEEVGIKVKGHREHVRSLKEQMCSIS